MEDPMNTKTFALAIAMGSLLIGCKSDKGDSGDSGATNACGDDGGEDGTDGGDGGDTTESCDLDGLGLCLEVVNGSDVSGWCDAVAANNGIDTTYNADACPAGADDQCDLTGVSTGDYAAQSGADRVTAYYYAEFPGDSDQACADAGGS
jgi:hypothetical protein